MNPQRTPSLDKAAIQRVLVAHFRGKATRLIASDLAVSYGMVVRLLKARGLTPISGPHGHRYKRKLPGKRRFDDFDLLDDEWRTL